MKNKVEMSLIVSNNQTNQDGSVREAVRKISDNLTSVQTFMSGRKNADGSYGDSASLEVNITSKTQIASDVKLEPKARIDVQGFFAPRAYTGKDGRKRTYFVLVANEITKTQFEGDGQPSTSAPQAPQAAQTAASTPAPVPDDVDDLPFV